MATTDADKKPLRVGATLNIRDGKLEEYIYHHDKQWPEVRHALQSVGIRNLSLWNWGNRLFFYAEYVGDEPYEEAMKKYAAMPRVQEWEDLMHNYQEQLPGSPPGVWWQPCKELFWQP